MAARLNRIIASTILTLSCFSSAPALAEKQEAPIRGTAADFAAQPTISLVAISADGERIAYAFTTETEDSQVRMVELATGKVTTVGLGKNKLWSLKFEDGGDVLVELGDSLQGYLRVDEVSRTYVLDFKTGQSRILLGTGGTVRSLNASIATVSLLPDAPNRIMMAALDYKYGGASGFGGALSLNLYEVATNNSKVDTIAYGTANTIQWLTDRIGKPLARVDFDPKDRVTTLNLADADGKFRAVLTIEGTPTTAIYLHGLSRDNRVIYEVLTNKAYGELFAIDPVSAVTKPFLRAEGVELTSTMVDPWTDRLYGVVLGGLEPVNQIFDAELAKAQDTLQTSFPDRMVTIAGFSRDRKKIVARVEAPTTPPVYVLLDVNGPKIQMIGRAFPGLNKIEMGRFQATTFKSRDGVDIPVYVTLPPGKSDASKAATVILPHGGPQSRDTPDYDYLVQFLATRGYAVIQPQFRGSTGFGKEFALAGYRQWGKRMQDDVSDAVDWAVKRGLTDPKRVCIVGTSYGGYAALAGATLTPDLYRCVVSVAGVADLPLMISHEIDDSDHKASASVNYWREHMGADDPDLIASVSPIRLVKNVKAPILLIHGRDDVIVRFEQSYLMGEALRAAGKSVKFVELPGGDHWLSRSPTREATLREIEVFLAQHIGTEPSN